MILNSDSPASFFSLDLLVKKLPQVIWPLEVSGSQNLIRSRISFRELPKTQMAGPCPWVSHTVCQRWALKICTFWTNSRLTLMLLGLRDRILRSSVLRLLLLLLLLLSRFSRVRLCATPEMAAHQSPPPLGFSRQEHWSRFTAYDNHDDFNRDWPSSQGQNIQLVLKWLRLYSLKVNT